MYTIWSINNSFYDRILTMMKIILKKKYQKPKLIMLNISKTKGGKTPKWFENKKKWNRNAGS